MDRINSDLANLRRQFDAAANKARLRLLRQARRRPQPNATQLAAYHEELLFLCAYPPSAALLAAATGELRRVTRLARRPEIATPLANSGIAGTTIQHTFSLDILYWLLERGESVAPAWDHAETDAALSELLGFVAHNSETDGLYSESLTWKAWLRRAAGPRQDGLAWLIEQLRRLPAPPELLDRVLDSLDFQVRWRPRSALSRTFARFPSRMVFWQQEPLVRGVDLPAILNQPVSTPRPLAPTAAQKLIDVARAALAVRLRETDPVTHANPREIRLVRLERGLDVALIGMLPRRRLPIESFFGYVAARNRVPIAYGGGWVFCDRCEIGVNLFDSFRGGESAHIFAQIMRVYRQVFRVRTFQVDPFQFGADNEEGLRSGAFWFYYRLGFRPTDAALARVAARDAALQARQPGYRSPLRVLRRLAGSTLALDVGPFGGSGIDLAAPTLELPKLGLAVTDWISEGFAGDRHAAESAATRRLVKCLPLRDLQRWSADEQIWLARLAPLFAMIPDLHRWSPSDRRACAAIIRAKGGPHEHTYAQRVRDHCRLRAAWAAIAKP